MKKEYIPLRSIEDFEEFIRDGFGNFELETYIEDPNDEHHMIYFIDFWGDGDFTEISYEGANLNVKNEEFFNVLYSLKLYEGKTFKEIFPLLKSPYTYYH